MFEYTRPVHEFSPEVWGWVSNSNNKSVVVPCFAKDVFQMTQVRGGGEHYYMIGRVPCLSVHLHGILVAIEAYEHRTIYQMDDGTAIINCVIKHPGRESDEGPQPPVASIADTISVIGTVHETTVSRKPTRNVVCSTIKPCNSNQEEVDHWKRVLDLHKQSCSLTTPFVIPLPVTKLMQPPSFEQPAISPECVTAPRTPTSKSRRRQALSPTRSETSSIADLPSSPARSTTGGCSSPRKLRHPSRIGRKDVTENLFREYMRHYIVHGPPPTEDTILDYSDSGDFSTPTKRCRDQTGEETPRPLKRKHKGKALAESTTSAPQLHAQLNDLHSQESMRGFTLSHLRRVPELALMADKLYRKKRDDAKKAGVQITEKPAPKIKRLFEMTVNELRLRSVVVLWSGPVHSLPRTDLGYSDSLWRMSSNRSQANASNLSSASTASQRSQLDFLEDLSDPSTDEESYVPLTTEYLARYVETTIEKLTAPDAVPAFPGLRQYRKPGPTVQRITSALKSSDERWKAISEYNVREALSLLDKQGRVWQTDRQDGGRWELTL